MRISTFALLPLLVIGAACGGSGSGSDAPPPADSTAVADDVEILGKVYDSTYSVPAGFFVDERATTTRSYTVHHVLDDSNSFERCSDDLVEAQDWEAADNASRAVSGYYVTSHENDRYFEFVRELAYNDDVGNISEPTSPGYGRVFKCSHTNRDGVDRTLLDGYAGRLDPARLNPDSLREFTEYLWQFTFLNVSAKKVITSYGDEMQHTLLLALLVNQGDGACDRVDVVEWRYVADPTNGEIMRQFDLLRSFEATIDAGLPAFCD